ncbi:MAG: hypothetical protein KA480_09220 [Anaerolineales bacterium]|nr:hypothetical protein [Anaerolineales bacterium]
MPTASLNSPLSYLGVLSMLAGFFLLLAGFNVIKVEKITVRAGRVTLGFGFIFIVMGILFLLPEIRAIFPQKETAVSEFDNGVTAIYIDLANDLPSSVSNAEYMDITESRIEIVDKNNLRFELKVNQDIPSVLGDRHFYAWFLDTDLNSNTGQQHGGIGSDYNVQVTYEPNLGWTGQVFDISKNSKVTVTSIDVSKNTVSITIPLSLIGSASKFDWVVRDQDSGNTYLDKVPNDWYVHTELP